MQLSTGVLVLYADDESFTLMTPQGHMFAGWITFSAFARRRTVAQAQVLMRANDPIYEMGLTMGGHKQEDRFWQHALSQLAGPLRRRGERRDAGGVRRSEAAVDEGGRTSGTAPRSARGIFMMGTPFRGHQEAVHAQARRLASRA